jgi:hypothetical protein
MVVFDVDGTIFPIGKGRCSEETLKALRACKEAGIITSPCSGRSIFMFPQEVREAINTRYVIYCNGAYIADPVTGEIADSNMVDPEKVEHYFRMFNDETIYHKISTFTRFIDDNPDKTAPESIPTIFVDDIYEALENLGEPLVKAEFFFRKSLKWKPLILDVLNRDKDLAISCALPDNIEINNLKATKGQAVRKLAELYGLSLDEVMAVGDGDNDASMLEAAGWGVAMGNGTENLKQHANAVVGSVEEDGFAEAIWKYVLQKPEL